MKKKKKRISWCFLLKSNRYWNSVCHLRLTKESWNSQSVDMVQSVVECSYTLHNCTNSIGNSSRWHRSALYSSIIYICCSWVLRSKPTITLAIYLLVSLLADNVHWIIQAVYWSAVEAVDFQNICYILTRKRNFNLINYMMFIWLRNISSTHWFTRIARFSFDRTWLHVWNKNTRIRQPSGIN